jgi:hypothetical protein
MANATLLIAPSVYHSSDYIMSHVSRRNSILRRNPAGEENVTIRIEPSEGFGSQIYTPNALEGEVFDMPYGGASKIPDFTNLTLLGLIYANALNIALESSNNCIPGIGKSDWFAVRYGGKFNIQKRGSYNFRLASDDGSRLLIDGAIVIDNDGIHAIQSRSGQVYLNNGIHEIEVDYFQASHDSALQLFVIPPGGSEELFLPEYGAIDSYSAISESTSHITGEPNTLSVNESLIENQSIFMEGESPLDNNTMPFEERVRIPFNANLLPLLSSISYVGDTTFSNTSLSHVGGAVIPSDIKVVKFYSRPGGASITIDSRKIGKTPGKVELDLGESHNYSIEKSGYKPYKGTLQGPQDTMVQVPLEPNKK